MLECPKCGQKSARYEVTKVDVYLRCLCGLCQLVATTLEYITIVHTDSGDKVSLPRHGTKLWHCLMMVNGLSRASSLEITDRLNLDGHEFTVSDVASQLTVLRYKGLVQSTDNKRGQVGGSTWECTDSAKKLLGG